MLSCASIEFGPATLEWNSQIYLVNFSTNTSLEENV
jgi:hypothetical protein